MISECCDCLWLRSCVSSQAMGCYDLYPARRVNFWFSLQCQHSHHPSPCVQMRNSERRSKTSDQLDRAQGMAFYHRVCFACYSVCHSLLSAAARAVRLDQLRQRLRSASSGNVLGDTPAQTFLFSYAQL